VQFEKPTSQEPAARRPFVAGGGFPRARGPMADLIRGRDWRETELGPAETWPLPLRTTLELCLEMALPTGVLWGPNLILFFNDAYAKLLGGREDIALGAPYFHYWGKQRDGHREALAAVLERGETRLLRDHTVLMSHEIGARPSVFDISYSPVRIETGEVAGIFAVASDTTQKVENERQWRDARSRLESAFDSNSRELVHSRAFLDSLVENIPNMVFVKDAEELRFVRFNRAGEELLGMSREELIGKNDFDFFPEEQAEAFTKKDREVLAGRTAVDIAEEPIDTRLLGKRILHTRKIPIVGPDGTPEYLLGISDDITEKLEAEAERLRLSREEAALQERENANSRVRLLAEASVALSVSLDFHVTLQRLASLVVPALADWCSITVHEADGRLARVAAVHHDSARKQVLDEFTREFEPDAAGNHGSGLVIRSGRTEFYPLLSDDALRRVARSPRHLELLRRLGTRSCIIAPILGRERAHGAIALVSGDSARTYSEADLRLAEELGRRAGIAIDNALLYSEAQKAIAARDAFLSIASHELKTPLTSLTLQAQMRRRQLDRENFAAFTPAKLVRMVEGDARQLDRLNRLIDDMLDISRIRAGKLAIHPEPVNLLQLVREIADRHAEQFARAGAALEVGGEDGVTGLWDRFRIEQVVTNLLSNALKYGGGKPVRVSVRAVGSEALLEVRDEGIGVAPADQERIFRQFERAVGPAEVSGLGLGLFIVKQILQLQGGTIRLESAPGKGSCFTVSLPAT
jgi:PAS domain S-box-containing protein